MEKKTNTGERFKQPLRKFLQLLMFNNSNSQQKIPVLYYDEFQEKVETNDQITKLEVRRWCCSFCLQMLKGP